jgi:hypothetical protein
MTFDDFKREVNAAGLSARDCGNGHWQILGGGFTVNFYPETRRGPVLCVAGMRGKRGTVQDAIAEASKPQPSEATQRPSRGKIIRRRKRLIAIDPHCHWCRAALTLETSTLDHKFPVSKGGHSGDDNTVLACVNCNKKRGSDMPEAAPEERPRRRELVAVETFDPMLD